MKVEASRSARCLRHRARSLDRRPEQIVGVLDDVAIALFGEESLPVRGVLGVETVPGHPRVKPPPAAGALGAKEPAQPLRLLLPRPKGARYLHRHTGFGE